MMNSVNCFINTNFDKNNKLCKSITYIVKIATSKNNKITTYDNENKYITNSKSLQLTHLLRATVDGILIGKNTLINDNPQLNVRLENLTDININKFVLWGSNDSEIYSYLEKHPDKTFITTFDSEKSNVCNVDKITIKNLELFLYSKNIHSLLVEGGNLIHNFFIESNSYDYFYKIISDDNITSGLSLNTNIAGYLSKNLNLNSEIRLNNNSLHIYN